MKFKVIGNDYELSHRFNIGDEVKFVDNCEDGIICEDDSGLRQILSENELVEIKE